MERPLSRPRRAYEPASSANANSRNTPYRAFYRTQSGGASSRVPGHAQADKPLTPSSRTPTRGEPQLGNPKFFRQRCHRIHTRQRRSNEFRMQAVRAARRRAASSHPPTRGADPAPRYPQASGAADPAPMADASHSGTGVPVGRGPAAAPRRPRAGRSPATEQDTAPVPMARTRIPPETRHTGPPPHRLAHPTPAVPARRPPRCPPAAAPAPAMHPRRYLPRRSTGGIRPCSHAYDRFDGASRGTAAREVLGAVCVGCASTDEDRKGRRCVIRSG
jgi:hypothetical protein